jgi:hypothetical protein
MQRALTQDREQDTFGLWAAMALELLARSAVSKVSPTLLADPDKDQKNVLYALGLGSGAAPKSIAISQVLILCKALIPSFTEEDLKAATALVARRNEELHTGAAAFLSYPTQHWLAGFYRCCKTLSEFQGETLASLMGAAEADAAKKILDETERNLADKIKSLIGAHMRVFNNKEAAEQERLRVEAVVQGELLSHQKHHRVNCPACACIATVQGEVYGGEQVEHGENKITVRQNVVPTKFHCTACGLKLNGYGELLVAKVADHFTHRSEYSPEEYYELVDPNDEVAMQSFAENHGYYHFSND